MDNGGVFLLGLFAFFFVLWIFGGGPQREISHQGVFITAATTTADDQYGYGPTPNVDLNVSLPNNANVSVKSQAGIPSISIARSSQQSSANPNQEYLEFTVTSHATSSVDLKDWKFVSTNLKSAAGITSDVTVEAGKTILVVTSFPTSASHDTMNLLTVNGDLVASATY